MINKLQEMMKQRNLTKADVSKGSGLPYTTIDGIFKKGYENMKLPTLQKLADFFNVTMEYLINDDIAECTNIKSSHLSSDEKQLIDDYRELSDQGQESIKQSMMMAKSTYKKIDLLRYMDKQA